MAEDGKVCMKTNWEVLEILHNIDMLPFCHDLTFMIIFYPSLFPFSFYGMLMIKKGSYGVIVNRGRVMVISFDRYYTF